MADELKDMETLQHRFPDKHAAGTAEINAARLVPALVIQSHPELERIGEICWMNGLLEGKVLAVGRNYPDFHNSKSLIGTPLADPYLSRSPFDLQLLKNGDIELDCADSNIRVFANNKQVTSSIKFTLEQLATGVVIELSERITLLLKQLSQREMITLENFNMAGISPRLQLVKEQIERLNGVDEPVLIRGDTGVGKELVAEAIYNVSNRKGKPFVKVNLGAIPSSLAAAELFGTKKGAFTGAVKDRSGFFVSANEGTLFLDEIGEASAEVQSMLLRVLETGELYPVGSDTPRKINVRVIAATDAPLEQMGKDKTFKQPLLHRLASYEIQLPSLYERKEDIGLLFSHFMKQQIPEFDQYYLQKKSESEIPWIPTRLMRALLNYHWPGNIRQIKNITGQLVIDSQDFSQLMMSEQVQLQLNSNEQVLAEPETVIIKPKRRKPNTVSSDELTKELAENLWAIQATADKLNISRTSIYELMKRYNLKSAADFSAVELEKSYRRNQQNIDDMVIELEVSKHALTRRLRELGLEVS